MTKGWTEERRPKARERIQKNKPWEKSTGPRTREGKQKSSLNALKHGGRSRIWKEYCDRMLEINNLSLVLTQSALEFRFKHAALTNELIEKANKAKAEGGAPHAE